MKMIDAHIHLDQYKDEEVRLILDNSILIDSLVTVSNNIESCKRNLQLSKQYSKIKPAFGFHPEQNLPSEQEMTDLLDWMNRHQTDMIAVGEVGLPYYLSRDQKVSISQKGRYLEILETFISLAKEWDKPIVLHAVYDDAPLVCRLLEKHSVTKAHFHWFKGDEPTISRMLENGYYISVTPEIVYKDKIQKIVHQYPLDLLMIETDGPWPFEGPFIGKRTQPIMMRESIATIAKIKSLSETEVSKRLLHNTKGFYMI
ncbi:TatD family hydrolase [Neobacillus dielmonensis]|uniref:TatD family hydrolase n=1 Tax=Neobacillus dielmonensis TaxID=1347369 RepID=UPI0005A74A99|nr:TatD family hydrolase [Neobacillus dielmonensis]